MWRTIAWKEVSNQIDHQEILQRPSVVFVTVFVQCHVSYSAESRVRMEQSSILTLLRSVHQTCMKLTSAEYTVKKTPDDGQRRCPKHVEFYNRINLNN
jgi:hypothetical protein